MHLKSFDGKCVRITTAAGEVYEGIVSYLSAEYVLHEYGREREALLLVPILFDPDELARVESLEDVNGAFGHYSEPYGLLERRCLAWGTDMIEEVLETEDDVQILRMLTCMDDHFQSLRDRAVGGMAPWRGGGGAPDPEDDDGQGAVYLGELESMLQTLIKTNGNGDVARAAKALLARLAQQ